MTGTINDIAYTSTTGIRAKLVPLMTQDIITLHEYYTTSTINDRVNTNSAGFMTRLVPSMTEDLLTEQELGHDLYH